MTDITKPRATSANNHHRYKHHQHLTPLTTSSTFKDTQGIKQQIVKYHSDLQQHKISLAAITKENQALSGMVSALLGESQLAVNSPELYVKINQGYLLMEAKKEINRLKETIKAQAETIEGLKRNIKMTKRNEALIENSVLLKEMMRVNALNLRLKEDAEGKEKINAEVNKLRNDFLKQSYVVLALNEKTGGYLDGIKERDEEIAKMRKRLEDKELRLKDSRIKVEYMKKVNERLIKEEGNQCNGDKEGDGKKRVKTPMKTCVLIRRQFGDVKDKGSKPLRNTAIVNYNRKLNDNTHTHTHTYTHTHTHSPNRTMIQCKSKLKALDTHNTNEEDESTNPNDNDIINDNPNDNRPSTPNLPVLSTNNPNENNNDNDQAITPEESDSFRALQKSINNP